MKPNKNIPPFLRSGTLLRLLAGTACLVGLAFNLLVSIQTFSAGHTSISHEKRQESPDGTVSAPHVTLCAHAPYRNQSLKGSPLLRTYLANTYEFGDLVKGSFGPMDPRMAAEPRVSHFSTKGRCYTYAERNQVGLLQRISL